METDNVDAILKKLQEQHDDIRELRRESMESGQAIAEHGVLLTEIRVTLKEEKSSRAANCLRHDERIAKLEEAVSTVTKAIGLITKFGAGFIAVGTFIATAWYILEKAWAKIAG